ncbi:MAG: type II toxin-antitoxin system VapC family toxin, partial [Deltaproteobacteria bacterium]|nr:type II toxin-antitoxin system VapC family toxin [Deltaproteobacteria bacterium]
MKLLLDTHVFIWWDSDPAKLSKKALALCADPGNTLFLSVASAWEMQIKMQLGKMKLAFSLQDIIREQQKTNGLQIMPVELEHALALHSLPAHHNDPFDRLLIAQARAESAVLVSKDKIFSTYPIDLIW